MSALSLAFFDLPLNLDGEVTKKVQRTFRKKLKRELSRHDWFKTPWHSEVLRINRVARNRRLTYKEILILKSQMSLEIIRTMANPIRRQLGYEGIARKIFKVEPLAES